MESAKRNPPSWIDTTSPQNDKPRTGQCPWCHQPILRALVGHIAALQVRADPFPLNAQQELTARLQGRTTYCLRLHPFMAARLINRSPEHIRAGRCTHLVVADHLCPSQSTP